MPFYYSFGGYYLTADWLLFMALIVVMIIGGIAQARVQSTFKKYNQVNARYAKPANMVARELLQRGNSNVQVVQVSGSLTDHYDPRNGTVGLSDSVYSSSSVGALAIAAHEIGHVMQHQEGYVPIKIRNAILPAVQFGSSAAPFIVLMGLLFSWYPLAIIGVFLFGFTFLFQLVTLPVEFNASRRGIEMLTSGGYITADESQGAKKVLRSAAMTYVVAALASAVSLLRLFIIAQRTRRR